MHAPLRYASAAVSLWRDKPFSPVFILPSFHFVVAIRGWFVLRQRERDVGVAKFIRSAQFVSGGGNHHILATVDHVGGGRRAADPGQSSGPQFGAVVLVEG